MLVGAINYKGNEIIRAYKGSINVGAKKEGILIWHPTEYHFFSCDECQINITPYAQQTAKLSALFQFVLGNSNSEIVANNSIKQSALIINESNIFSKINIKENVSLSRIRKVENALYTLELNKINTSLSRIRFIEVSEIFLKNVEFNNSLSRIRWIDTIINCVINGNYIPDPSAVIRINPKIIQKYNISLSCDQSVIRFVNKNFGAIIDDLLRYGKSQRLDNKQEIGAILDFFLRLKSSRRLVVSWKVFILNKTILQRRKSSRAQIHINNSLNPKTLLRVRNSAQNYAKVLSWLVVLDNFLISESTEGIAKFDLQIILATLYRITDSSYLVANLQEKLNICENYITGFANNIDITNKNRIITKAKLIENYSAIQEALHKQQFLISENYLPILTSNLISSKKIFILSEKTLYAYPSAQISALQKMLVTMAADAITATGSDIFGKEDIFGIYNFLIAANESLSSLIDNSIVGIQAIDIHNSEKKSTKLSYCVNGDYRTISLYPEEKKKIFVEPIFTTIFDLQIIAKKNSLLKYTKSINQLKENVKFSRPKKWKGKWAKWEITAPCIPNFFARKRQRWFINVSNCSFELCNIGITEGLLYIKLNKNILSYGSGILSLRELKDTFGFVKSGSNSWTVNFLNETLPFNLGEERSQFYVENKIDAKAASRIYFRKQLLSTVDNFIIIRLKKALQNMLNIIYYSKVFQSIDEVKEFTKDNILKYDFNIFMQLPTYYYLGVFSKNFSTMVENYFAKSFYSSHFEKAYIYTNSSSVLSQTYKFYLDINSIINNIESISTNILTIDQWLWPLTENSIEARPEGNILIRQVYSYSNNGKII